MNLVDKLLEKLAPLPKTLHGRCCTYPSYNVQYRKTVTIVPDSAGKHRCLCDLSGQCQLEGQVTAEAVRRSLNQY